MQYFSWTFLTNFEVASVSESVVWISPFNEAPMPIALALKSPVISAVVSNCDDTVSVISFSLPFSLITLFQSEQEMNWLNLHHNIKTSHKSLLYWDSNCSWLLCNSNSTFSLVSAISSIATCVASFGLSQQISMHPDRCNSFSPILTGHWILYNFWYWVKHPVKQAYVLSLCCYIRFRDKRKAPDSDG